MRDSYVPDASFSSLVLTLSSSAWVGLGKIADPITGEIKKDLKSAKFTIDTLIMLREKTKGNLSEDESKLLQAVIGDLQGNYAEVVFAGEKSGGKVSGETDASDEKDASEETDASDEKDASGEKKKDEKIKKEDPLDVKENVKKTDGTKKSADKNRATEEKPER